MRIASALTCLTLALATSAARADGVDRRGAFRQPSLPGSAPAAPSSPPPPADSARVDGCLREAFAARGLNPYGDPPGALYMGGTPLFDEAGGRGRTLAEYAERKHPELVARCRLKAR